MQITRSPNEAAEAHTEATEGQHGSNRSPHGAAEDHNEEPTTHRTHTDEDRERGTKAHGENPDGKHTGHRRTENHEGPKTTKRTKDRQRTKDHGESKTTNRKHTTREAHNERTKVSAEKNAAKQAGQ